MSTLPTTSTTKPTAAAAAASTPAKPAAAGGPVMLPPKGAARVKSVLSGDSLILLGKAVAPNVPPPEVIFTFESLSAPRMASKSIGSDEAGAFVAREWLRKLVVGKTVRFETHKQGATAGERAYGWVFLDGPDGPVHLALECVRQGHATPKSIKYPGHGNKSSGAGGDDAGDTADEDDYESQLLKAYKEAQENKRNIHSDVPLVRTMKNAGEDFSVAALAEACQKHASQKRLLCVLEYLFDGSRYRCHITDPQLPEYQHASFTLILAGVTCPRLGNPKLDPPTPTEPFSQEARQFVTARLLQRELPICLVGTDKSGTHAVGTVHHPVGNIAVELLKHGLARMTDWSVRLLGAADVPALRVAENAAKRTNVGVWQSYQAPVLTNAAELRGVVVEVTSGDTIAVLPDGKEYDSDAVLSKVSLASVRAPRMGSALAGRPDEPYAMECKDRLRVLTIGKTISMVIHYERDIPIRPGELEKRSFGTLTVGKNADVAQVLIQEGLAQTQRHRDDDEKSPRYDELRAAEATAKAAKKGVHKEGEYKGGTVNDLTDQRKAKSYSGSLMRAGSIKAVVEYVFNGALFKVYVPSENCHIRFSPNYIRCPQPSASAGSRQPGKPAEPFGDQAKFHARLTVLQRQVEIICSGVTNGGIIIGSMYTGFGNQRRDYTIELLGAGYANLDQRKVEYNEVPKTLLDAEQVAKGNKVGLWSIEQPKKATVAVKSDEKYTEKVLKVKLSEIRNGSSFFYHVVGDEAASVMDESMKLFTENNGTAGGPCDAKPGKIVAALFDDGSGKLWYRAKVVERKGPGKVGVLFVDYGNTAVVPVASHLRPLDLSLGIDRIPAVAKEAVLALTTTRALSTDEGMSAAQMLQSLCWGKELTLRTFCPDDANKMTVSVLVDGSDETVNAQIIADGWARAGKTGDALAARMTDSNGMVKLAAEVKVAEETARRTRSGMWRYGDVGDEDPDEL